MQSGLVPLSDTDDALFDKIVDTNLKGTFNTLRVAAKKLRQGGRIVNFSSSVARLGFAGYSIYVATKSAVETMTNIFAKEL
jgi:3-oxoacyl-[acyl-carrier protein] reductase